MKRTAILLISICMLVLSAQAQRNKSQQISRFLYMSSIGYSGGVGNIELLDYHNDAFLPIHYDENSILKTIRNNNFNIDVNQLFAYQFNNYFYMGIGAGISFWHYTAFVPLYLNLSVNMMDSKIAPTAYLNLGYSFKWYISSQPEIMTRVVHGATTGPMGEFGLGVRIKLNDKLGLLLAGNYKVQHSSINYTIPDAAAGDFSAFYTNASQNLLYHFAGIRLGLQY